MSSELLWVCLAKQPKSVIVSQVEVESGMFLATISELLNIKKTSLSCGILKIRTIGHAQHQKTSLLNIKKHHYLDRLVVKLVMTSIKKTSQPDHGHLTQTSWMTAVGSPCFSNQPTQPSASWSIARSWRGVTLVGWIDMSHG